jgi:hypothetical protein
MTPKKVAAGLALVAITGTFVSLIIAAAGWRGVALIVVAVALVRVIDWAIGVWSE